MASSTQNDSNVATRRGIPARADRGLKSTAKFNRRYATKRRFIFLLAVLLAFAGCRNASNNDANQPYKIGFVLALSGAGSVFADAARQGMELAVEQINATNAAGRPIAITIVDDATDPRTAAEVCNRLVTQERVNAIIGYENTPSRVACNQAAQRAGIPYVASSMSGGDLCIANLFQVGMVPNQQITAMADYLLKSGAKKFYLLGSDYSSPKASFEIAKSYLTSKGAEIVGASFEPIGASDFAADLAKIAEAKPDYVIEALTAADEIPFYKQFRTDARTANQNIASIELKVSTAKAIGEQVRDVITASSYYPSIRSPANEAYLNAMKQKFGDKGQASESAILPFDAAHLLANAIKAANTSDGAAVTNALRTASWDGPRGRIAFGNGVNYATLDVYIATAGTDGGFTVKEKVSALEPRLSCK
jgi:urea transport system substrate-binding protein